VPKKYRIPVINDVRLTGYACADVRITEGTARFLVGHRKTWRDQETNEPRERSSYLRVRASGRLLKTAALIKTGTAVYVEGELESCLPVDGSRKNAVTNVVCTDLQILSAVDAPQTLKIPITDDEYKEPGDDDAREWEY